jgi:hypothetical protein
MHGDNANRISLGTRENTARLWELFSAPFPHTPTRRLAALTFYRLQHTKRLESLHRRKPLLTLSTSTFTPPSPFLPFLRGTYFGSTSSIPKMDSSPSTLRIMARCIYRTALPTGLRPRPRLPIHRRPLSSGVYSLFGRTHASSHERTTIATPPCPSSSTLDRTRVP